MSTEFLILAAIILIVGIVLYVKKNPQVLASAETSLTSSHVVQMFEAHTRGVTAVAQAVGAAVNPPAPAAAPAAAPAPAPPAAAPAGSVTLPDGTVISQAQANLMGITQASVDAMPKVPVAAPSASTGAPNTDATFAPPINGAYYMRDVPNNGSVTSPTFLMKAGTYQVWATEGLTRGQGNAVLDGVGPLTGSSIVVPVDTNVTITMTAIPGNLDPTSGGVTKLCVQFQGPAA